MLLCVETACASAALYIFLTSTYLIQIVFCFFFDVTPVYVSQDCVESPPVFMVYQFNLNKVMHCYSDEFYLNPLSIYSISQLV